ncbi:MAG: hypothetical protein COY38_00110 [Candidatus Aenigmarchaeota archaeon CG_4_10_14_0_8_um_filter_37_24]|nr:MAG: hypothetical protein AUJ50_04175 [Candidatus Aenigmarchaeota archaeon CG1_02_38_14]PIV69074.1 MAG: hypothetical protein COS07_01980 [Candidatus Aenigmarchaeota archaeon CG01_land_8_20_14_3_00_37_9]PIW41678.1 MAG: hypothetical protein COW21_00635 [Candidatus Aenigmarchaeota archaeon CG15_BIG_FIL_POST_REV_8_21_14_020_37_27]PIX51041.1 MAG: hypothetical protein COZ52_00965 [Candidatus Aenigmarchaeota archaeon CG_4_8_14_3_um_filter_37_24]PIY35943.1 MAG: hypothetical protein COZ04_01810 [Cand
MKFFGKSNFLKGEMGILLQNKRILRGDWQPGFADVRLFVGWVAGFLRGFAGGVVNRMEVDPSGGCRGEERG